MLAYVLISRESVFQLLFEKKKKQHSRRKTRPLFSCETFEIFTEYFTADYPIVFSLDPKLGNSNYSGIIKSGINLITLNLLGYPHTKAKQKSRLCRNSLYLLSLLLVLSLSLIARSQANYSLWQMLYKQDIKVQKDDRKMTCVCVLQVKTQNKDVKGKLVNA